jgi:hypothetical protein
MKVDIYETNRSGTFICLQSGAEPTKVLPERLYEFGVPDNIGLRLLGLFKTIDTEIGPFVVADAIGLRQKIEKQGYAVITWEARFKETTSSDLELVRKLFFHNKRLETYSVMECRFDPNSPKQLILKLKPAVGTQEDLEMLLSVVFGRFAGLISTLSLVDPSGAVCNYRLPPIKRQ